MVHHGIHIARIDEKSQPGTSETAKILRAVPVRLRENRHLIAMAF